MKSIRFKVLTLILACIIIVASISGYLVMSISFSTHQQEVEESLKIQAYNNGLSFNKEIRAVEKSVNAIERLVTTSIDALKFISDEAYVSHFIRTIDSGIYRIAKDMSPSLSAYVFFNPDIHKRAYDIWYGDLDASGEPKRQISLDLSYYDFHKDSKDWYFVPRRTLEPYWTNPYDGNLEFNTHMIFVSYTKPIVLKETFIGVVGSDYYYEDFMKLIGRYRFGKSGSAMLLNSDGELMIQPENDVFTDGRLEFWLRQKLLYHDSGIINVDSTEDWYMSYVKLDNGWIYAEMIKKHELFEWYTLLKQLLLVVVIVLMSIMSIIILKYVSFMISPLLDLKKKVADISAGDYDVTIENQLLLKSDEVGQLARSIEKLRLIQKRHFQKLHEQNALLTSKVVERTENLAFSHDALETSLTQNKLKEKELGDLNASLEEAINQMKATQVQLIQSEKLAAFSIMATKLSHEFNTPLGSFLTMLSYLKRQKDHSYHTKNTESFLTKFDACFRLMNEYLREWDALMHGFEDYKKSKKLRIELKSFIELTLKSLPYYEALDVEIYCEDSLWVYVDTGKLSSLFMLIVENSYLHGYNSQPGKIIIYVEMEEELMVSIHDEGVGIPETILSEIFIPFYNQSEQEKKIGFGLPAVYQIVTSYFQGEVWCTSTPKGTAFYMTLRMERV